MVCPPSNTQPVGTHRNASAESIKDEIVGTLHAASGFHPHGRRDAARRVRMKLFFKQILHFSKKLFSRLHHTKNLFFGNRIDAIVITLFPQLLNS